jgi:hypothetical protein
MQEITVEAGYERVIGVFLFLSGGLVGPVSVSL